MYNLPHYKASNEKEVYDFIKQYPFTFISGCDEQQHPIATQIPVFIEEKNGKKILRGHLMKNTDHHLAFLSNNNILCVFTGKYTYVSATWYTNQNIPSTWNYMSVHAKGKITFTDEDELEEILQMTSLHFENGDEDSPTVYNNLPTDYKKKLLQYIVGFEITIEHIDSVFKLSQDRNKESYQNIIKNLKQQDEASKMIAEEMEKRQAKLFN